MQALILRRFCCGFDTVEVSVLDEKACISEGPGGNGLLQDFMVSCLLIDDPACYMRTRGDANTGPYLVDGR